MANRVRSIFEIKKGMCLKIPNCFKVNHPICI